MKKPLRTNIRIAFRDENDTVVKRDIEAWLFDEYFGLAVNKLTGAKPGEPIGELWDEENNCFIWAVTHVESGRSIFEGFYCLAEAAAYLKAAGESGFDWTKSMEELVKSPGFPAKIKGLQFDHFCDSLQRTEIPLCRCKYVEESEGELDV